VKKARSKELHELAASQKRRTLQSALGQCVDVLWERGEPCEQGFVHSGYTPNYLKVDVISSTNLSNRITATHLDSMDNDRIIGRIVDI